MQPDYLFSCPRLYIHSYVTLAVHIVWVTLILLLLPIGYAYYLGWTVFNERKR